MTQIYLLHYKMFAYNSTEGIIFLSFLCTWAVIMAIIHYMTYKQERENERLSREWFINANHRINEATQRVNEMIQDTTTPPLSAPVESSSSHQTPSQPPVEPP